MFYVFLRSIARIARLEALAEARFSGNPLLNLQHLTVSPPSEGSDDLMKPRGKSVQFTTLVLDQGVLPRYCNQHKKGRKMHTVCVCVCAEAPIRGSWWCHAKRPNYKKEQNICYIQSISLVNQAQLKTRQANASSLSAISEFL